MSHLLVATMWAAGAWILPANGALAQTASASAATAELSALSGGTAAGRPRAHGWLQVRLNVRTSCLLSASPDADAPPVQCTRGVRYRTHLTNLSGAGAPAPANAALQAAPDGLAPLSALQLFVEF